MAKRPKTSSTSASSPASPGASSPSKATLAKGGPLLSSQLVSEDVRRHVQENFGHAVTLYPLRKPVSSGSKQG